MDIVAGRPSPSGASGGAVLRGIEFEGHCRDFRIVARKGTEFSYAPCPDGVDAGFVGEIDNFDILADIGVVFGFDQRDVFGIVCVFGVRTDITGLVDIGVVIEKDHVKGVDAGSTLLAVFALKPVSAVAPVGIFAELCRAAADINTPVLLVDKAENAGAGAVTRDKFHDRAVQPHGVCGPSLHRIDFF